MEAGASAFVGTHWAIDNRTALSVGSFYLKAIMTGMSASDVKLRATSKGVPPFHLNRGSAPNSNSNSTNDGDALRLAATCSAGMSFTRGKFGFAPARRRSHTSSGATLF